MDIYQFLTEQNVAFKRFDHAAVYTVQQANELRLPIEGLATKNLFLRDGKGKRHWLWVGASQDSVDLAKLAQRLGVKRLSLASSERLANYLKSSPGQVSLLDMFNAQPKQVTLVVTSTVWHSTDLQCHPFDNTVTLQVKTSHLMPLLGKLDNELVVLTE